MTKKNGLLSQKKLEAVVGQKMAYLAIFFGGSSWPKKMAYLAKKKLEAVVDQKMAYLAIFFWRQ